MADVNETRESLERIQAFDTATLPRREELGQNFAFEQAVEPAKKLINLFRKLPVDSLSEYPETQLGIIKANCDQVYNIFKQILEFNETEADAQSRKTQIINQIEEQYSSVFTKLFPFISYSVARTVDFNRLEEQGRAIIQSIDDKTDALVRDLETAKSQASEALEEVRTAAAEQGVSQQAYYFKEEAERENKDAIKWLNTTRNWAIVLIFYGVVSIFFHKWEWINPKSTSEAILFVSSKLIVFAVIAFMLIQASKNYLAHKHNFIINRHRQTALQTFQALVAAGSTNVTQDIILNHAAACIFTPQETGYTKHSQGAPNSSNTVTDVITRSVLRSETSGHG